MLFILISLTLLAASGLAAFCLKRFDAVANYLGGLGAVFSGCIGLTGLFIVFNGSKFKELNLFWSLPYASFSLAIDSLSALFLLPIFVLTVFSAIYGVEYLRHFYGKKNIGSAWLFFNFLVLGMILVVIARNAVLFLVAWEIMSLSSFFLVLFENEKKGVLKAGLIYLTATHIGTLFLMVMFILLSKSSGSFDFFGVKAIESGITSSIIFLCALIGFGTKAGFMPLHIWLPEAHPAAPCHVSALMSGVMIKTGIYGIVRVISFLSMPPVWWGYTLISIGIFSGILGILFALAQHDLKRLLAYSSIENIGIITLSLGFGVLGMSLNDSLLIVLGFSAGLLHVVNHAFFKGLLFLAAGAVLHTTGTCQIDRLGGLLKKMPVTGACFLVGAVAICGLPPLNGFISEFLIYLTCFKSLFSTISVSIVSLSAIGSLALIGALAVACFTKVFGVIFLGLARSNSPQKGIEPGLLMRLSMVVLSVGCVILGLVFPFVLKLFQSAVFDITGLSLNIISSNLIEAVNPLRFVVIAAFLLFLLIVAISLLRKRLLIRRNLKSVSTWDCGYSDSEQVIQYTASSYVEPLLCFFKGILRTQKQGSELKGYFPDNSFFKTETFDFFGNSLFRPALKVIHQLAGRLTCLQHGRTQFYILYIFFTLLVLLIWKL
ncbi:MAG: proton-conducting transporter membrane subunit [Candidatus Omnitrophica bacterium]|nr:proton-conducting transporter membrane subunit [Candidatus Omnitrophota bacterium]